MVTVSVPGKVHLMGEHAVVYGKPAILASINLRMRVSVETTPEIRKNGAVHIVSEEPSEYAQYAAEYVMKALAVNTPRPITITIDSDIPAGFHLGSSAGVAVGVTGALMYFYRNIWNPAKINELAYEIEKKQHRNPSGGDNTAVTVGGFVWFRRELEFLKSIWQLPFQPHPSLNHFFLINTGRPKETTGEMVAFVRSQFKKNPSKMERLLNLNEQQVKRVTVALKEGREDELIGAIKIGEETLKGFGVVGKKVQPLIRTIESLGGAVKILGGGGKADGVGFLLCYHKDRSQIDAVTEHAGYKTQNIILGGEGVRLERKI